MLSILSELPSCCVCWFILSSISFIEKKCKRTTGERECKNKLFFLELEDAIISKVNNHNDSVRRHSHARGAIHLSEATPLCAKFA